METKTRVKLFKIDGSQKDTQPDLLSGDTGYIDGYVWKSISAHNVFDELIAVVVFDKGKIRGVNINQLIPIVC